MKDEQFDRLLRDAAQTYNPPPALADPEATWRAIERALPGAPAEATHPTLGLLDGEAHAMLPAAPRTGARPWKHPWARLAAMLLVGVAIGRVTAGRDARVADDVVSRDLPRATATALPAAAVAHVMPGPDQAAADEYLARTAALLAVLPDSLQTWRGDAQYMAQAEALLLQTRLLLDSPAATDPTLRALFDDLEIVLAQVVRLDARRDPMGVDFLHQALEQRDVLPRLRDAVAGSGAD